MKTRIKTLCIISIAALSLFSCKKQDDDGEEMTINFKTDPGYVASDQTLDSGTSVKIGIKAETDNKKDPIIRFNISESVNGYTASTVYSQDLEDKEFEYDFNTTLSDTTSGNKHLYTFTVTNKDGFNRQQSLTLTVK